LISLSLVISNAISIGVRERQAELAVLKVLGFRPWQILVMVLGEALMIGVLAGAFSAGATFLVVNYGLGGFKFPIAFFPAFYIPQQALWWGPSVGLITALVGSFVPAQTACRVRVSEIFAKVA
jgi:putative ABC transport system permease protein